MENAERPDEKAVQAVFQHAAQLMAQGKSARDIENDLEQRGLNHESAAAVVRKLSEIRAKAAREAGQKNMLVGALWCIGGIVVTVMTYQAARSGGTYFVAWGAIVFGAIQFFRGVGQTTDLGSREVRGEMHAETAPSKISSKPKLTSDTSTAQIQVTTSYPAFSTMQAACVPVIEIDGKASKGPWGTRSFLVSPGRHTVKAYHRWLLFDQAFASEVTVDVPEGAVVCLHWRTGHVVFLPGMWTQLQSGTEVTLVSKEEQAALTRPCPSCGKTIKCEADVCEHCGQITF